MSEAPERRFFSRLESLRGIAALTVVAFHASQTVWGITAPPYEKYPDGLANGIIFTLFNGQGAVNLFFVLSGFVLTASIHRGGQANIGRGITRFLIARAFRIYPAVWASILLYAAINLFLGIDNSLATIISNMLLWSHSLNIVNWSLQLELLAIPLILLLGFTGPSISIIAVPILCVLVFTKVWTQGLGGPLSLNPLVAFALGAVALHARKLTETMPKPFAALALCAGVILLYAPRAILEKSTAGFRWINLLEVFGSYFVVAMVAYRPDLKFLKFLDHQALRFFGAISFGIYLLHSIWIIFVSHFPKLIQFPFAAGTPEAALVVVAAACFIAATTPIAYFLWITVEKPGIALGSSLLAGTALRRREV